MKKYISYFISVFALIFTFSSIVYAATPPITAYQGGTGVNGIATGAIPFGQGATNLRVGTSTNLFWDNTNSRLGVGTSTPTNPLTLPAGSNALPSLSFGDTQTGITRRSANAFATVNAGNYGFNFFSGSVQSDTAGGIDILTSTPTVTSPNIVPNRSDTTTGIGGASGTLSLITAGVSRLFLDNAGNVGIGTTSPFARLSIAGLSLGTTNLLAISTSTATATTTVFRVSANGNLHFLNGAGIDIGNGVTPPPDGLVTKGAVGIGISPFISQLEVEGTTSDATSNALAAWNSALSPILVAQDNQFVGIATSTPKAGLAINADTYLGNNPSFAIGSTSQSLFQVGNDGGVTIGSANGNATQSTLSFVRGTVVVTGSIGGNPSTGSSGQPFNIVNGGNAGDVTINASGIVGNGFTFTGTTFREGIGSSSPFARLSITGLNNATIPLFAVSTSSNGTTTVAEIDSLGNFLAGFFGAKVGIGTTSPFANLSLVGNNTALFAIATSTAAVSNTPIFEIDNTGHVVTSGPKPTLSSCGTTNSLSGNDSNGTIMFTGTLVTACTLNRANPVKSGNTLECQASSNTTAAFADINATTTSSVTFGLSATLSSGSIFYACQEHVNN